MSASKTLLRQMALPLVRSRVPLAKRWIHSKICSPRPVVPCIVPGLANSASPRRWNSSEASDVEALEAPDYLNEAELNIWNKLKDHFQPIRLEVQDISGGCGSMYALDIVSAQFKGLPVIKQHRLVNSVLGEEIKKWHGVQLKTKAS